MEIKTIVIGNRIRAVDFNDIIRSVEMDVINRLWDMDLLEGLKPTCKVFQRLFLYNVIKETCEFAKNYKSHEKLLFMITDNGIELELFKYCHDRDIMLDYILKAAKTIGRNLPITFYNSKLTIKDLSDLDAKSGEIVGFTNDAMQRMRSNHTQSFERVKKFVRDQGLTFLSESYFKDIGTKNILFA